jgi:integrase
MKSKNQLTSNSEFEKFELTFWEQQNHDAKLELEVLKIQKERQAQRHIRYKEEVSKRCGFLVDDTNFEEELDKLPLMTQYEIIDIAWEKPNDLIRPSHFVREFSLLQKRPDLQKYIPTVGKNATGLQLLSDQSKSRMYEIVNEFTSENTRLAHIGDLVYWQAWLSAIGWSFIEQSPTLEIVLSFIIQHVEGLDTAIDEKLVEQGYKTKLGPHSLATVKRRVGSLSVFLSRAKWSNPCRNEEVSLLFQKLTKKYGSSKPSGKAITKDILDDMLDTCGNEKLIDVRDRALLLFAWGSGGRRRAEVASADMKDLTPSSEGDFVYNIPHSKTDQTGKGHPVPVKGRAANALIVWLNVSSVKSGPIFRSISKSGIIREALSPKDVHRIVRLRLKRAGYNELHYSAHSLRSGFVTEAGRRGKPLGDVMAMTTHKNVTTAMRYYQAGNINNNSAANLAD